MASSDNRSYVVVAVVLILSGIHCKDPCETNHILDYMEARFRESPLNNGRCDKYSIPSEGNWYRAEGQDMVTSAPFVNQSCGSVYPIWLKGTIPKTHFKTVDATACVAGARTDCDESIHIRIKNCKDYNVYFLKPPADCPVWYCFEFTTAGLPTLEKTQKPKVSADLIEVQQGRLPVQELQFKCDFAALSYAYFYQIQWFIDDKPSFLAPSKRYEFLRKDTYLGEHENDENLGYTRLGINVQCQVRLKIDENGPPGPVSEKSDKLFAGIEVPKSISVKRTDIGVIKIQATVPFGCNILPGNVRTKCNITIEMDVPENEKDTCSPEIKGKYCSYSLTNTRWNEPVNVEFLVGSTGAYDIGNPDGYRIRFKTQPRDSTGNIHWGNYILPDVHVHVFEDTVEVWKGKRCQAHSDPHMLTFDQRAYENQYDGKFILYRGNDAIYMTEVHVEHTKCYRSSFPTPYCVCAIAVRAGNDLFVIDRCPNRIRTIGFKSCGEDVLDARMVHEFEYKVFFSTGMYVQILIDDNFAGRHVSTMNINIYPSAKDKDRTYGLCGTLNGHVEDDFMNRQKQKVDRVSFINDWRVTPEKGDKDLLKMTQTEAKELPHWPTHSFYCTCSHKGKDPGKLDYCDSSNLLSCSKDDDQKMPPERCHVRHKRSLSVKFSFRPNNMVFPQSMTPEQIRNKRDRKSAQLKIWTKEEATKYCSDFMEESVTFRSCKDIPSIQPNISIENCALDIMLTNSTDWADLSRRSFRMACMKELKYNNSLADPGENETESIADIIKALSCPSDCSGHGTCLNGKCTCNDGFGAQDCSMNLDTPPLVYGINTDDGGICDLNDCPSAFVEGDGFLKSKALKCKLQYFEADMNNTIKVLHDTVVDGQHYSLTEVHCPMPNRRKRASSSSTDGFVHGFMVSISNNNKHFSSLHPIYFLDGTCQDTVNVSGNLGFKVKENFCYIGARCIAQGTFQPYNKCGRCDSTTSPVHWTWVPGCTLTGSKTNNMSTGAIAGISVGMVIALLVFILLGFTLYKMKSENKASKRTTQNYPSIPNISDSGKPEYKRKEFLQ